MECFNYELVTEHVTMAWGNQAGHMVCHIYLIDC